MFLKVIIAAAVVGAVVSGFGTHWLSQFFVGSTLSPTEAAVSATISIIFAIIGGYLTFAFATFLSLVVWMSQTGE